MRYRIFLVVFIIFFSVLSAQTEREKEIQGVVISKAKTQYKNKKENPAYVIMQEVWKHKRNNGLQKFNSYKYKEYEKIEFDV
ncbi:MAG: hypothetical protein Q4G16_08450, partial [Cruoricaptor ignavus]|nr:hypothetical protein [Cruoricaptor ignavus]